MVIIKSPGEIEKIRRSSEIVSEILQQLKKKSKPGVSTKNLNEEAEILIENYDATAAFKNYRGFPYSLCTSVNDEVIHGLPSDRLLEDGDILSLDFGVECDGFFGDACITFPIGEVSATAKDIIEATKNCLCVGIENAVAGCYLSDISYAIQKCGEESGYYPVRKFVGHGIGKALHEAPQIPNYGEPGRRIKLKEGMTFAIEPMLTETETETIFNKDKWTVRTRNGCLSTHFEHTIVITEDGPEILSEKIT